MSGRFRQNVPRPIEVRAGARPPWAGLGADAPAHISLAAARAALGADAPVRGRAAARAAVLVPLFARGGECWCVLTRRSRVLTRNPGDMAFPGGRLDRGETPLEGALREAEEEIGLRPGSVEVLGPLGIVERPRDGVHIAAFVGVLEDPGQLVAATAEVEAIVEVPLGCLLEVGACWLEEWVENGERRSVPFFSHVRYLGDDVVWGATGRILVELLARICASGGDALGGTGA